MKFKVRAANIKLTILAATLVTMLIFEYRYLITPASLLIHAPVEIVAEPTSLTVSRDVESDIRTILARPLFQVGRRPMEIAKTSSVGRLTGILISQKDKFLIFAGTNGKPVVVTEGSQIGSDIVQSITPEQAVLVGPDGPRTIRPSFAPPPNTVIKTDIIPDQTKPVHELESRVSKGQGVHAK